MAQVVVEWVGEWAGGMAWHHMVEGYTLQEVGEVVPGLHAAAGGGIAGPAQAC